MNFKTPTYVDTVPAGVALTDGDKGDVVVSGDGASWALDSAVATAAGRALMDDASAAAQRTTLGLGTAAQSATGDFEAAGAIATHNAVTTAHGITAFGASLVDDVDAAAARTTLLAAPLASPTFTGTPAAPTAAPGTNTTQLATTAYADAIAALKANLASPTFTGVPSAPTAAPGTNTTQIATTAFAAAIAALKANLASPTFTGTVTVPGLTINDATDFTISATTGSKIGQATSKVGFFGVAPAVRPTALTQTYSTASATHAAVTQLAAPAGGVGVAAGGWSSAANRDLAITSINAARTDIANLKNFVNQIVDQLQALGLLQ